MPWHGEVDVRPGPAASRSAAAASIAGRRSSRSNCSCALSAGRSARPPSSGTSSISPVIHPTGAIGRRGMSGPGRARRCWRSPVGMPKRRSTSALKSGGVSVAPVRQLLANFRRHVSRVRAEDDNPVGQEHGFFDAVGDDHHGPGCFRLDQRFQQVGTKILRGQDIERENASSTSKISGSTAQARANDALPASPESSFGSADSNPSRPMRSIARMDRARQPAGGMWSPAEHPQGARRVRRVRQCRLTREERAARMMTRMRTLVRVEGRCQPSPA